MLRIFAVEFVRSFRRARAITALASKRANGPESDPFATCPPIAPLPPRFCAPSPPGHVSLLCSC
jgi:hypothetical protein